MRPVPATGGPALELNRSIARGLIQFLYNMDARRWRAALVMVLLFAATAAIFLAGKSALGLEAEHRLEAWLTGFRGSPWALIATIVLFTVTAFVGAPQFLLIAACVVAFGPWYGFAYSWIATVASGAVTFYVGRIAGARALDRFAGGTLDRLRRFVGANAFYASFIIRNVPSAPFIVVNMAFGLSRASFLGFITGCALGVLPKTALVAFFGGSFMTAVEGDGFWSAAMLAGIGVVWLAVMLGVRELVRRRQARAGGGEGEAPPAA